MGNAFMISASLLVGLLFVGVEVRLNARAVFISECQKQHLLANDCANQYLEYMRGIENKQK